MKITSFSLFVVAILLGFFIKNQIDIDTNQKNMIVETKYNRAIDTATQDAAKAMITNASQPLESQYQSSKKVRINKEQAVATFFKTMYLNFGVNHDLTGQGVLDGYIPVLVVVGYDGYFVYTYEEYTDTTGQKKLKHVWSPKKPYAYADQYGNTFNFTLDDYVTVNRNSDRQWFEGFREEIKDEASVSFLNDAQIFDQVRRSTIVNAIQNDLGYAINQYNTVSKKYGISYTFTIPQISQEDWNNTINDAGVLAFVQGIPVGTEYYNNYALGGARIVKKDIYNGITANGRKYYYPADSCKTNFATEEVFTSGKDAAQSGYIPLNCSIGYKN